MVLTNVILIPEYDAIATEDNLPLISLISTRPEIHTTLLGFGNLKVLEVKHAFRLCQKNTLSSEILYRKDMKTTICTILAKKRKRRKREKLQNMKTIICANLGQKRRKKKDIKTTIRTSLTCLSCSMG